MSHEPDDRPTRSVGHTVEIAAPIERVWRALTEAEELRRWFPLDARVEPGQGGSIWMSWQNEYEGTIKILEWSPPHHLRTTWGPEDADGLAQTTDFDLESQGDRTILKVITSGFPTDPTWDDWVEGTDLGWRFELSSLKHYLEGHAGEDRLAVYLRRRVEMPAAEVWSRLVGPNGLDLDELEAELSDEIPDRQRVAVLGNPSGALLRLSIEPCLIGTEGRDVTIWLTGWGEQAADSLHAALENKLRRGLADLFPDGADV